MKNIKSQDMKCEDLIKILDRTVLGEYKNEFKKYSDQDIKLYITN